MSNALLGRKQLRELIELRVRCQKQEWALRSMKDTAFVLSGQFGQEEGLPLWLKQNLEEQAREMLEIINDGLSEAAVDEVSNGAV